MSESRATVVHWGDIASPPADGFPPHLDPAFHQYKILAEGDSWFTFNDLASSGEWPTNILFNLRFAKSTLLVQCATPGDTLKNMGQIASNTALREALSRNGLKWDLILISGGGNDLLERADRILKSAADRDPAASEPADFCNQAEANEFFDNIQRKHREIASHRDDDGGVAAGKPIITHTYDYATPRNAPARFIGMPLIGPWIFKLFRDQDKQVPEAMWVPLANYLIDRLAESLIALTDPQTGIANFHVVETRGTLVPAELGSTGNNNDWINEFHPNGQGYRKIVARWHAVIAGLL